jgi:C-terminal processing protease CtpA/Prc
MGSIYEVACMGMQLAQSSGLYPEVVDLKSGGTAESDGVLKGDIIIRIDDEEISGFSPGSNIWTRDVLGFSCL